MTCEERNRFQSCQSLSHRLLTNPESPPVGEGECYWKKWKKSDESLREMEDLEVVSVRRVSCQQTRLGSPRPAEHWPVLDSFPQWPPLQSPQHPRSPPPSPDHPQHTLLKHSNHGGRWSRSQLSPGGGGVTPWTCCRFITGPYKKERHLNLLSPNSPRNHNCLGRTGLQTAYFQPFKHPLAVLVLGRL